MNAEVSLAKSRSNARKKAMQALYQWEMTGNELNEIEVQFYNEQDMAKVDTDYFHELLHQVPTQVDELDQAFAPYLELKGQELGPIEQAILRLSSYELKNRLDVPFQVVIKEAIVLAKTFAAEKSHKFVNGVLDKLAKQWREIEVKQQN